MHTSTYHSRGLASSRHWRWIAEVWCLPASNNRPAKQDAAREKTESLSPQKFVAKRLDHPSLMLLFLFGLATGEAQIDELTVRQPIRDPLNQTKRSKTLASTKQSQLIAIASAEGMLLRSICNYPQEFQLMVNRVLQMETITKSA